MLRVTDYLDDPQTDQKLVLLSCESDWQWIGADRCYIARMQEAPNAKLHSPIADYGR